MIILETIAVAFSLFSRLPVPNVNWSERNMRYMLCAFPLVGAVIGPLLLAWIWLCGLLGAGQILFAAGITLLPVLITGGIHLDGFCDTVDALASRASPERRREILKDPHMGAFAAIGLCSYLLLYFALASELAAAPGTALSLGLMHVVSRTLSGIASLCFPGVSAAEGMLARFRESAATRSAALILLIIFIAAAPGLIWLSWPAGAAMVFSSLVSLYVLRHAVIGKFGGMSGDLAGWFLQTAELVMLAALVIVEKAVLK